MADVQKLRDLLERCEKASGPSEQMDAEIIAALLAPKDAKVAQSPINGKWVIYAGGIGRNGQPRLWEQRPLGYEPRPTASLDASIALVERMLPGATYSIDNITGPEARIYLDAVEWEFEAESMTLPLALLSALLRALISQAEGERA